MKDVLSMIVHEDPAFLVVDKPAKLPTVPLKDDPSGKETLLGLVGSKYPEVLSVAGKNPWEGGVVHRLDTATSGLVVLARTSEAYASLMAIQKAELFIKEYKAVSSRCQVPALPGFPQYPYEDPFACKGKEVSIGSLFRRYGEHQQQVRPVCPDSPKHLLEKTSGTWYLTKVSYSGQTAQGAQEFTCRISSGFRHQVRVHLAWSGWPLDGDAVYQGAEQEALALRAVAVLFPHPLYSEPQEFRIDTIK